MTCLTNFSGIISILSTCNSAQAETGLSHAAGGLPLILIDLCRSASGNGDYDIEISYIDIEIYLIGPFD